MLCSDFAFTSYTIGNIAVTFSRSEVVSFIALTFWTKGQPLIHFAQGNACFPNSFAAT